MKTYFEKVSVVKEAPKHKGWFFVETKIGIVGIADWNGSYWESNDIPPLDILYWLKESPPQDNVDWDKLKTLGEWLLNNAYPDFDNQCWHLHEGMDGRNYTFEQILQKFKHESKTIFN